MAMPERALRAAATPEPNPGYAQPFPLPPAGTVTRRNRRGWLVRRALLVSDVVGLSVAFVAAELAFGPPGGSAGRTVEFLVFFASLPGWIAVAKLYELYDRDEERTHHTTSDDLVGVFHLVTVGAWLFFVVSWLTKIAEPTLPKLTTFWALAVVLLSLGRAAARSFCRRRTAYRQRTIVVGAGEVGQLVARKLLQHPEYGIELTGFVDRSPLAPRPEVDALPVLGPPERLPELIAAHSVDRVAVAFSGDTHERTLGLVRTLKGLNVQIDIVPRLFEAVGPNVGMHDVEGLPLVALPTVKPFPFAARIKRVTDVVGASVALLLTAPIFALAAWRVKRDSPGPVFFRQTRLGKDMREFTTLKFRTMRIDVDQSSHKEFIKQTMSSKATVNENGIYKLDRGDAITRSGRWLRKTSLDELPQLLNVLRGDMSLVGPRPCIPYETEFFAPHHFERFLVPGGITGLWQVTARAHSTFGEALDMDVAYARSWSVLLDLSLIARTPFQLLRQRRATA